MRCILLGSLSLFAFNATAAHSQSVRFRVTDDIDEAPVPTALVTLLSDRELRRTDDGGILVVTVKHAGPNVFTFRRIGFDPISTTLDVPEKGMLKVHVVMHHSAQKLDAVKVSDAATNAQLSVFDRRRMSSVGGQFITLADIERRAPIETLDLLRNRLGIRVAGTMIESTRGGGMAGEQCLPRVGLDGMVFEASAGPLLSSADGGSSSSPAAGTAASVGEQFDVNSIQPNEIYGIEIYSGPATIPAEYLSGGPGTSCGLIMIWTFSGAQQSTRMP